MLLTDDQDVIKLLHAVNLRQELVDNGVVHTCAAGACASLLADGIQLIEDNDMETAVGSQLEKDQIIKFSVFLSNIVRRVPLSMSHPLLFLLGLGK